MPGPNDDAPECREISNVSRIWGFVYDATLGQLVAKLKVFGIAPPTQEDPLPGGNPFLPYDPDGNPNGWRPSQAVDWGSLDALMESYALALAQQNITLEAIEKQNKEVLEHLRCINGGPLEKD